MGPVVGGPEVGRRGREEKREKGKRERERGSPAAARSELGRWCGGRRWVAGIRGGSPTAGRLLVTEKTLGEKGNVRSGFGMESRVSGLGSGFRMGSGLSFETGVWFRDRGRCQVSRHESWSGFKNWVGVGIWDWGQRQVLGVR
ncbi:hypothetical protein TIFTF001_028689 [Ficus carica]|uniref:Uncharacterized protein n=1 Tax=Ficus carica TaxID=3494 RepID=A0AA88DQD7_FICCA|nr:hypothetical protein TIFTF001_028689 [Ficus carica]